MFQYPDWSLHPGREYLGVCAGDHGVVERKGGIYSNSTAWMAFNELEIQEFLLEAEDFLGTSVC